MLATLPFAALCGAALADVPKVVTDIPPIHALVSQVMGDLGTPVLLLAKGADEHDFQLRPSQMSDIAQADLVVWIGPNLTPWLDSALENAKPGAVSLPLLGLAGTQILTGFIEEDGEHSHEDHAKETNAGVADLPDDVDPHAWMDPANAAYWVDMIAVELASADQPNAAQYQANATAAKERIAALDTELTALLAPSKDRPFVTFHAAYAYFTTHYDLSFAGSLAMGDAATPGAARLRELQDTLSKGVVCAFPEVQHDPALLLQILDGTGTKTGAAIDPVGSSLPIGPDAYETLMRTLATNLAECLQRT